jgi:hypothetical protein
MRCSPFALAAALCLCTAPLHAQPLGTFQGAMQTMTARSDLSGTALACLSDDDPRDMDTFVMLKGQDGVEVMLVLRSPAPQTGEYDLDRFRPGSEEAPSASLYMPREGGRKSWYRARNGTLRLTTASADRLEGTVEFLAQEMEGPNDALRAALRFSAERIGGMTEGNCVRPAAGTAPTASAGAALVGAQVAPGTAALALRTAQGSFTNSATVDFCPTAEGLDIDGATVGGGRLIISRVPARPGRFTVGIEDNEVFVSVDPGDRSKSWAADAGFVRVTDVTPERVRGSLETDISPIGVPNSGPTQLAVVFDAPVNPRCSGR